jgi:hypothetical protein
VLWLEPGAGAQGSFVSYLVAAGACGGFDRFVADPKAQQIAVDVDIALGTGMVAPDADLLPGHAHDAVGTDSAADPVIAGAISASRPRGERWCRRAGCWGEPLCWGGHVQRLMRAGARMGSISCHVASLGVYGPIVSGADPSAFAGIMSASRETASLGKPWSGRESRSRACCEAPLSMTTHTEFSFRSCCSPDVLRLNHFASLVFGPSASAARN